MANSFADRFSIYYSDVIVPRFYGTTREPAPYGLYGYTIFLFFFFSSANKPTKYFGYILSFLIILSSLSDQIILSFLMFAVFLFFSMKKHLILRLMIFCSVFIPIAFYISNRIFDKIIHSSQGVDSFGQSAGERIFYLEYVLSEMTGSLSTMFFGFGPGQLGLHLNSDVGLPSTTSPMLLLTDVLASGGLMLFIPILFLLGYTFRKTNVVKWALLSLLVANFFQHDWKSTMFFFSLSNLLFITSYGNDTLTRLTNAGIVKKSLY